MFKHHTRSGILDLKNNMIPTCTWHHTWSEMILDDMIIWCNWYHTWSEYLTSKILYDVLDIIFEVILFTCLLEYDIYIWCWFLNMIWFTWHYTWSENLTSYLKWYDVLDIILEVRTWHHTWHTHMTYTTPTSYLKWELDIILDIYIWRIPPPKPKIGL